MPGFLVTCHYNSLGTSLDHYNSLGTSLDKSHWIHTDLPRRFLSMPTCPRIRSWVYVSIYFSSLTHAGDWEWHSSWCCGDHP
jgi:hypothetical protein